MALSVTEAPEGNEAPQLEPAVPSVIAQEIPVGAEVTVPLPLAPPCTVRSKLFAGGVKTALTERSAFIVTWQDSGLSVTGASQPVHATVLPLEGLAVIVSTMSDLMSFEQVPLSVTRPALKLTVQVRPARLDTSKPPAVLPVPWSVSVNLPLPRAAAVASGAPGSTDWSRQA